MKRSLFLFVAVSALSYGVFFSSVVHPGSAIASYTSTPTSTQSPNNVAGTAIAPHKEIISTPTLLPAPLDISRPKLEGFIRVPSGVVPQPYVILSGYQSFPGDTGNLTIIGSVQSKSFYCPLSPCALIFPETGQIKFRIKNQAGDSSSEVDANILVTKVANGYSTTILTLGKFVVFSDSCANIWQNGESLPPDWAKFPQDPGELNTEKNLYYLAARLLTAGAVDAKDCPNGGWEGNSPNACGMTKVKNQMVAWQNQYDLNIWLVGRDEHIPPIILKTLLEIESQFWPTSQRLFLDELGLGQINQLGIDVLLRTNPGLYQQVCTNALYKCDKPYENLTGIDRALIRGTIVQSLDAACPTCLYGVNLNKASQSISLIAKVLYANCVQANSILKLHSVTANYEDSWKFALVSYHSGFGCLQNAVDLASITEGKISWQSVSENLSCQGAVGYIDKFWASLNGFNKSLKQPGELTFTSLQIPTPVPTPTPFFSNAHIMVKIFVDKNGDGIQQQGETLENVQVNLDLENGVSFTQITRDGKAEFSLGNVSVGVKGKVSLPGLYRSASIQVPPSGEIPIIFIFARPILPTQLPY